MGGKKEVKGRETEGGKRGGSEEAGVSATGMRPQWSERWEVFLWDSLLAPCIGKSAALTPRMPYHFRTVRTNTLNPGRHIWLNHP